MVTNKSWMVVLFAILLSCQIAFADVQQPGNPEKSGNPTEVTPSDYKAKEETKKETTKKEPQSELDFTASKIQTAENNKYLVLVGLVKITYGKTVLFADAVVVYPDTKEVYAEGGVKLVQGNKTMRSEKIFYNFETNGGMVMSPKIYSPIENQAEAEGWTFFKPGKQMWLLSAANVKKVEGEEKYIASKAILTTSKFAKPHWKIRSSKTVFEPGKKFTSYNNVLFLGPLPIFYVPVVSKDLKRGSSWVKISAGETDEWGPYAFTKMNYKVSDSLSLDAELDYRKHQGQSFGLDFQYKISDIGWGEIDTYFIHEIQKDEDGLRYAALDNNDELRNDDRAKLDWTQRLDFDIMPNSKYDFFKDWRWDTVLRWRQDRYFQREYFEYMDKTERDITSYTNFHKRGFAYSFELYSQARVNEWRNETEYLPEIRLQYLSQPIWRSGFFYESYTSGGNLTRRFDEDLNMDEYRSARLHTEHRVSYPFKILKSLTFEPYIGGIASAYDQGSIANNDDVSRESFLYGGDLVYRVFKDYDCKSFGVSKLRHVVLAGAEYRGITDPEEDFSEIDQFDNYDMWDESGKLTLFLRNYIMAKVGDNENSSTYNLLDFELRMNFWVDDEHALREHYDRHDGNLEAYLQFAISPKLYAYVETEYDFHEGESVVFNGGITYKHNDRFFVMLEDRYYSEGYYGNMDSSNEIGAIVGMAFNDKWGMRLAARYETKHINGRDPDFTDQRITFYRRFPDWEASFTYYRDEYDIDQGFFMGIELYGMPSRSSH